MGTEQPQWHIAIRGSCAIIIFIINSGLPPVPKHYYTTTPIVRSSYLHYFSHLLRLLFLLYFGTFVAFMVETFRQHEFSNTTVAFSEALPSLSLAFEWELLISQGQEPTWYRHVISWILLLLFETVNVIYLNLQPNTPLLDISTSYLKGLTIISLLAFFFHLKEYKQLSGSDLENATDDGTEHPAKPPNALRIQREAREEVRELGGWWPFLRRFHIFLEYMWPWCQYVLQLRAVLAITIGLVESILDYLTPIQYAILVDALAVGNEGVVWRSFRNLTLLKILNSTMSLVTIRKVLWMEVSIYRQRKLKLDVQTHILTLDTSFHSQVPATDLIKAVDYARGIDKLFDDLLFSFVPNLVRFSLAISGLRNRFGSFMMLIVVYTVFSYYLLMKRCITVLARERDRYIKVNGQQERRRQDGVRGWATVLNHNQANFEISRFRSEVSSFSDQMRRYFVGFYSFETLESWTLSIGRLAAESFILRMIFDGKLSIGDLFAFHGLWELLVESITFFSGIITEKLEEILNSTRLRRVLESKPTVQDGEAALECNKGDIEFQNIQFSYPGTENNILEHLNLKIEGGTTVAIVGPSGVGKSTLIQLIKRLHNPTRGVILIDGLDISSVENGSLQKHVGMMPQNPFFFNTTVMDNLLYAKQNATVEEVHNAACRAGIHESITNFKDGYATIVEANGGNLSGGQLQRLALTRLFLQNPKIVLIDEGTSALDANTEALIKQSIEQYFAGHTRIIIAHRLSSIKSADRILVLGQGAEILEDGKHTDLINGNGQYARLWKIHIGEDKQLIDLS